jgi:hypothetical protein
MKGVTVEWSKWEGITLDTKRYKIYTALSEVRCHSVATPATRASMRSSAGPTL